MSVKETSKKPRPFRILAFMTYLPLPLLGIIVIFGVLGKLLEIGWLESAPGVLNIPMFLAYYIAMFMGAIYGVLKNEKQVYISAVISIAIWIIIFLIYMVAAPPRAVGYTLTALFGAGLLYLHIRQYLATKKWESRLVRAR